MARVGEQDNQRFPELGPPTQIAAGVLFREIRLESPSDERIGTHKLYVYTPRGEHRENSLPCIFIAGGSSIPLTGTGLGPADEPEHIPYVSAGFVVIGYEVDGYLPDPDRATKQMILDAIKEYRAAEAGLVNAEQAIEFALAKLPEVDANRL